MNGYSTHNRCSATNPHIIPNQNLPSFAVALSGDVNALEQKLRLGTTPIVGRIHNDRYLLDVRTLWEADFPAIITAIREAQV